MKRHLFLFLAAGCLLCQVVTAQKKDDKKKEISKPPKGISWQIKDKETNAEFNIIPYEVISPAGHKKCRELIKEGDEGFMFFIVVIDNEKGKDTIEFNAFGGDACFYYQPPKDPSKPKDPPPEPRKYGFVALKNYFDDPGNTPADKAAYKKIQEQFKTALKIPVGKIDWSLCCIRAGFLYDLPRNKVTWAIPGALPVEMKVKKYSKSTLKKANVDLFEEEK